MRAAFVLVACAWLACACEAVPDLTFLEAGLDGSADGAGGEDGAVGSGADGSAVGSCPGTNPPPAPFVCCGSVACVGRCNNQCDQCNAACLGTGLVCCAKTNSVTCIDTNTPCH